LWQAAIGAAHLLISAMGEEGVSEKDAIQKIWMVDSKGLIVKVCCILCRAAEIND